jgi:hypothetical protein
MPALTSLPGICQARHDDLALFFAHKKEGQKTHKNGCSSPPDPDGGF